MEIVTRLTVLAAIVLAFSFVIERTLELLKAAYDLIDSRYDLHRFWTRRATRTRDYIEQRMRVFEYVEPRIAATFLGRFDAYLRGGTAPDPGGVPTLCGDLVRAATVKVALKLVGIALGLTLSLIYDLNLFRIAGDAVSIDQRLGVVLTGVAMGLGSSVVHKAITALERKREGKSFVEVPNAVG